MKPKKLVRREFIGLSTLGVLGLSSGARIFANELIAPSPRELLLYVGTYTSGKSEGIYVYKFDLSSGEFKHLATAKGIVDPSFLAIEPRRRHLYAVNEIEEFGGKPGGAVSAFKVDPQTGNLQFLNQQPSLGGAPCYVTVDKFGKFILVANYGGGNAEVLPINDSGLGKHGDMVQHGGYNVDPGGQKRPQALKLIIDATNVHTSVTHLI